MMGGREESWTARLTASRDPRLVERGWIAFVEWYARPSDAWAAAAILRGDKYECAQHAKLQTEPLRSFMYAVVEGYALEQCEIPAWDYAEPEHVLGYDELDVLAQLRELLR